MGPEAGMAKTASKAAAVAADVDARRSVVGRLGVATAVAEVGVEASAEQPRETASRQARIGSRGLVTSTLDSQARKYSQVVFSPIRQRCGDYPNPSDQPNPPDPP
ncbi:MAG: hypothetical protein AAB403_05420 [Planctomycetota bacterium]